MKHYILAIDQGTTNSRAIIFDKSGRTISQHSLALQQSFPHSGWVEQDPLELIENTIQCCQQALKKSGLHVDQIAAIGISNQRETTIIWDKITGEPIYPAIVWQDRRTTHLCQELSTLPIAKSIQERTGLMLDPYFSATKIMWLLDNVPHARERASQSQLLFGTVDTFLLWKLAKDHPHLTDITNASRTLMFNIHTQQWDEEILDAFNIPKALLPTVCDNTYHFGDLTSMILGRHIPIMGMVGDQQAATIGQACFKVGMLKITYGTGSFLVLNTGKTIVKSNNQLLSTVAYRINGDICYALEGSIFSAGTIIKWLRDQAHLIDHVEETETMAKDVKSNGGVIFIPAFTGLGAPYWDPSLRAAILGINSDTTNKHIVRAALESIAFQTRDLFEAMQKDLNTNTKLNEAPSYTIRVDGGMTANIWLLQFISDILNLSIERPECIETTALGAAYLAGLGAGVYKSLDDIAMNWQLNLKMYPTLDADKREHLYDQWLCAVRSMIH